MNRHDAWVRYSNENRKLSESAGVPGWLWKSEELFRDLLEEGEVSRADEKFSLIDPSLAEWKSFESLTSQFFLDFESCEPLGLFVSYRKMVLPRQFSYLYLELKAHASFSETLHLSIAGAPAVDQSQHLRICECNSDDLTLFSWMRESWIVDDGGFRRYEMGDWEYDEVHRQEPDFFSRRPYLKFSSNGKRMRYGLRLGPDRYYFSNEAPLTQTDGRFIPERSVSIFP